MDNTRTVSVNDTLNLVNIIVYHLIGYTIILPIVWFTIGLFYNAFGLSIIRNADICINMHISVIIVVSVAINLATDNPIRK